MRYVAGTGESQRIRVPTTTAKQRLDVFLVAQLGDTSRAFVQRLIRDQLITIDDQPAKASRKIRGGEAITICIPDPVELSAEPENIPLDVLFEDEMLIVLNKQPHFVVHPSPGHEAGTLVNALLYYCHELSGVGGTFRPGIVHRLDRDTSGCILVAKTDTAHRHLAAQFAARTVAKTYLAITQSPPRPADGAVEGNIGRHPKTRKKQALLTKGGRSSLTHYKTLETFSACALVECHPLTGRTHQIRVHLKSVYAPILCDADYGRGGVLLAGAVTSSKPNVESLPAAEKIILARQALHAAKLEFHHPTTEAAITITAPLHADMEAALLSLRMESED